LKEQDRVSRNNMEAVHFRVLGDWYYNGKALATKKTKE